jgi:hypothetical protein
MEEIKLKELLMNDARRGGICTEGYAQMRVYDRDELIGYYLANPDWCMERSFPSLELLRREFSDIEDKGVFVGRTFNGEVFDKLQTYIFHDCKGTIRVAMDYENAVIPMLYFANGCRMRVECEQTNDPAINVPLYIAEDCKVTGAKSDNCNFKRKTIKLIKK